VCKTNQCYHNKPFYYPPRSSLSPPPTAHTRRKLMNIQRTSCPRDARGVQRLTYTLVDHKWVCFADCCRVAEASRAGPGGSVEYASLWGPAPLACPAIWRAAYIGSIICTAPISRRFVCPSCPDTRSRAHPAPRNGCVTPRCVDHRSFSAASRDASRNLISLFIILIQTLRQVFSVFIITLILNR